MVATCPSASPGSWRPTSRALGALFAGSAVMFGTALVQGGSLVAPEEQVRSATEPAAEGRGASSPAAVPGVDARTASPPPLAPGQAAPWTPGAAPDWGTPLRELPVRRAPVQEAPRQSPAAPTAPTNAEQSGSWQAEPPSGGARTEPAEQSGGNVIDDMLGYLSGKIGS